MSDCSTCEGRGVLGKRLHWTDCPPDCERMHAQTCVSCMGSGRGGKRPTLTDAAAKIGRAVVHFVTDARGNVTIEKEAS